MFSMEILVMEQEHALPAFQVVVSERTNYKLGSGRTARKTEGCICYYAEKKDQGQIFIQPLNGQDVPSGKKTYLDDHEFCRRFKPEPLIYYNKVKPAIDSPGSDAGQGRAASKGPAP